MTDALVAHSVTVSLAARRVVHDVSLRAHHGELLAIVGPNGAGKSTLLKALAGLLARKGTVQIAGRDVANLRPKERAALLGYVPQRTAMADGVRVYDVVAQARYLQRTSFLGLAREHDPRILHALERMGVEGLTERAFDTLSGGEQRRVLVARALASTARILLLDEPTAGLDVAQALLLFAQLATLRSEGYALLCVLHDLDEVYRHADRTLLLHQGAVVAAGPTRSVLTHEALHAVYGVHTHEHAALGFSLDGSWR